MRATRGRGADKPTIVLIHGAWIVGHICASPNARALGDDDLYTKVWPIPSSNGVVGACATPSQSPRLTRFDMTAMLFARVMGDKYAGTPLANYFISNPDNVPE